MIIARIILKYMPDFFEILVTCWNQNRLIHRMKDGVILPGGSLISTEDKRLNEPHTFYQMLKVVRNSDVKVTCVCVIIHLIQSNI